jgi:hypothetical protein
LLIYSSLAAIHHAPAAALILPLLAVAVRNVLLAVSDVVGAVY